MPRRLVAGWAVQVFLIVCMVIAAVDAVMGAVTRAALGGAIVGGVVMAVGTLGRRVEVSNGSLRVRSSWLARPVSIDRGMVESISVQTRWAFSSVGVETSGRAPSWILIAPPTLFAEAAARRLQAHLERTLGP